MVDHVQVVTPTGWPAVSTPVLRSLAGRPGAAKLALAELTGDTSADTGGSPVKVVRIKASGVCRVHASLCSLL